MTKEKKRRKETGVEKDPHFKDASDPQPESTHGGNMSDYGGKEHSRGTKEPKGVRDDAVRERASSDQSNPSDIEKERLREEGEMDGRRRKESLYQGGQGQKLPAESSDEDEDGRD